MADLRFRTFRMKVYARLCPPQVSPEEREVFVQLIDRQNEDGMAVFFARHRGDSTSQRVRKILQEAREIGDRLNVLDRTLPTLPHSEVGECYARLRSLGDELAGIEALEALK
jgi:hypothetical protein